jgi:hypothetical protein
MVSPIVAGDVEGRNMIKFTSKQVSGQSQLHLTYDWNMNALTALEGFITRGKMHKVLTIIFAHNATDPSNEFS